MIKSFGTVCRSSGFGEVSVRIPVVFNVLKGSCLGANRKLSKVPVIGVFVSHQLCGSAILCGAGAFERYAMPLGAVR
jgi:hypothetical protein